MTLFAKETPSYLEEYRTFILSILKDVAELCEKNKINWWLESGTLLGLVRHGDFIPWDDDIDIALERADYNRFLSIAQSDIEFTKKYKLWTEKDHHNIWGFVKVVSDKYTVVEKIDGKYCQKMNAFIDVFPFESTSTNFISHVINSNHRRFMFYQKKLIKGYSLKVIFKHYVAILIATIAKFIKKINDSIYKKDGLVLLRTNYNVIHRKEVVFPTQEVMFRDVKVKIPNNKKKYLETIFGRNYMQPPPENNRFVHAEIIIRNN